MMKEITTTEIKHLLIEAFDLEKDADQLPDDTAIVGAGLDLDSVDVLEIISIARQKFNIRIRNQDIKKNAFSSIGALTQFLNQQAVGQD